MVPLVSKRIVIMKLRYVTENNTNCWKRKENYQYNKFDHCFTVQCATSSFR